MEKISLLAKRALFAISLCFLFLLSSCTTENQDDELYVVQAQASTKSTKTERKIKDKDKPKDEDFIDRKKIQTPGKRKQKKKK